MPNENPSSSNIITLILCVAIIAVGVFYFVRRNDAITVNQTPTAATSTETTVMSDMTSATTSSTTTETLIANGLVMISDHSKLCGLHIESPTPNSKIAFPLVITGTIDNAQATAGCGWTTFEGQAGTVQLYVDNAGLSWDPVGKLSTIAVENALATSTKFKATVNFDNKGNGFKSGTKLRVRFTEEDPSGNKKIQVVDLPVELQ